MRETLLRWKRNSQPWLAFFSLYFHFFIFLFNSRILWRENEGIHQARGRKGEEKGTERCLLSNLLKSRMVLLLMALFISGNGFGVLGIRGTGGREWIVDFALLSFKLCMGMNLGFLFLR